MHTKAISLQTPIQKFLAAALIGALFLAVALPAQASHQDDPQVAAWLPWFQLEEGMKSARDNFDTLDTLYLFVYEAVDENIISERADLHSDEWEEFLDDARAEGIELIPTISWFIGDAIHETLSDPGRREAHIEMIVELVDENEYDGVDIDYEQKRADTIDHFSAFLEELNDALDDRVLACSIEARTPPESKWRDVPEDIEYANDYEAINEHCNRVNIMAYDQQRIDWRLNTDRQGVPYAPVADVEWVEKVLEFALEDIDAEKIMLGVPTYGRAWDVTVAPMWYRDYTVVAGLNQPRILDLSEKYNAPTGRAVGGEAVISYFPDDSIYSVLDRLPVLPGTPPGYEAAMKALLFATFTEIEVPVRFVSWSDARAVGDKLELANNYDLRGISIFKIDGEEDPAIWDLF